MAALCRKTCLFKSRSCSWPAASLVNETSHMILDGIHVCSTIIQDRFNISDLSLFKSTTSISNSSCNVGLNTSFSWAPECDWNVTENKIVNKVISLLPICKQIFFFRKLVKRLMEESWSDSVNESSAVY